MGDQWIKPGDRELGDHDSKVCHVFSCDRGKRIRVLKVREVIPLAEREESDLSAAKAYDLTKAGSVSLIKISPRCSIRPHH